MSARRLLANCLVIVSVLTVCPATFSQDPAMVIGYLSADEPSAGDEVLIGTPVLDEFGDPLFDDFDRPIREGGFFAEHYPDYELAWLGQCVHPDFLTCEDLGIDADDGLYSMFFMGESISSSRADGLIETSVPVIVNEQFAYDNWGITGDNTNHGSPGTENENGVLDGGSHLGAEIQIVNSEHPIAVGAGLSEGVVSVLDPDGALIWGTPAASADVIAVIPGFEDFGTAASIFVYEEGDILANGEEAFGMRIGNFLSDIGTGSTGLKEGELLTPEGLALLKSTVDFALGIEPTPPMPPACEPGIGDFNGSGTVDFNDFLTLARNFGMEGGSEQGDLDCSGTIDFLDFLGLAQNFGKSASATAAAVPEPYGLFLFAMGLLAFGKLRQRQSC